MRFFSLLAAVLVGLFVVSPAMAGKISYADGKGKWVSTNCTAPEAPASMKRNPEAAADDLNARTMAHNKYAEAAQAYMACISEEAQSDAESFAILITNSAQTVINQTQNDVSASAAWARSKAK